MLTPNGNYRNLKDSYLFFGISKKVEAYRKAHPDLPLYRLGIGDVSRPLCDAAIQAMHDAVEDQSRAETFHGYVPECGIPEYRKAVAGAERVSFCQKHSRCLIYTGGAALIIFLKLLIFFQR